MNLDVHFLARRQRRTLVRDDFLSCPYTVKTETEPRKTQYNSSLSHQHLDAIHAKLTVDREPILHTAWSRREGTEKKGLVREEGLVVHAEKQGNNWCQN